MVNNISFPGYYDTAPASITAEPMVGDDMINVKLDLTGGSSPGGFGVAAGGLALHRSSTAYATPFGCSGATNTTGGSGSGLKVDCTTIVQTASWGTDNTSTFISALQAMQTYNDGLMGTPANYAYAPKCLYIPAGNYLTGPWKTQVVGRNDYCGDSTWDLGLSNVFVIPNIQGDMIQIVDAGGRIPDQQQGGTITYSDTSTPSANYLKAGCAVNGITFVGLRESTAIQNAVMVYGPAQWCHFGYYAFYMRGRALGVGVNAHGNASIAESVLDDYRFEHDGDIDSTDMTTGKTVHVPTIDITALGTGTINNVRSKTGRIYQSFGASVRIADCGTSSTGSHNVTIYGGTHLEASAMAGSGAGGDILQLGDSTCGTEEWTDASNNPVTGTNNSMGDAELDVQLTNPEYGHAALRIQGSANYLAHNISGALEIGGAADALGKGVVEESCQNCQMHFENNAPQDYQLTAVSSPTGGLLGANNTYNANSSEGSLTTNLEASQQPTGSTPQQYPLWTSRPNFPTWSTASGLTAFPGGGGTNATLLTAGINSVSKVVTAGDSVILEPSRLGGCQIVINSGANAMQVWGNTSNSMPDFINGAASVPQIPNTTVSYCVSASNAWSATLLANIALSGSGADLVAGSVPNTALANASMTFGGQSVALGSSAATQGNGGKIQLATGSATAGHCLEYDASGNAIDAGATCETRESKLMTCNVVQPGGTTAYYPIEGLCPSASASESLVNNTPVPFAGTFRNLYAQISAAPGASGTVTFTLRVNGASTGVTCTMILTETACHDTTHVATIAVGQTADLQVVSGAVTASARENFGIELDNP